MGVRVCPGSDIWTTKLIGIVCASGLALALSSSSVFAQAGAASASTADCGFCLELSRQLEPSADRGAALELCHVLSGALGQLGQHRAAFLDDPHYVDLFPLIYWHVTRIEMQRLHDREFSYPIEKMQQMLMYLDAYIVSRAHWFANRGGERHWQRHLAAARDADEDSQGIGHGMAFDTPALIDQVLTLGNSAHVEFDFPRAIRDSFVHRHHPILTAGELHPDFVKTNDTLRAATSAGSEEIVAAIRRTASWDPVLVSSVQRWGPMVAAISSWVIEKRAVAWTVAFGGGPLPTGDEPSPLTDHDQLARAGRPYCAATFAGVR